MLKLPTHAGNVWHWVCLPYPCLVRLVENVFRSGVSIFSLVYDRQFMPFLMYHLLITQVDNKGMFALCFWLIFVFCLFGIGLTLQPYMALNSQSSSCSLYLSTYAWFFRERLSRAGLSALINNFQDSHVGVYYPNKHKKKENRKGRHVITTKKHCFGQPCLVSAQGMTGVLRL